MKRWFWLILAMMLFNSLILDAASGEKAGLKSSYTNNDAYLFNRFYPAVIRADGMDVTKFEVATIVTDVQKVELYWGPSSMWWQNMYDDGTHGDRITGDGIYTLDNISRTIVNFHNFFGKDYYESFPSFRIITTPGDTLKKWGHLGLVNKDTYFRAADLGNGCYATTSAFFIVDTPGEIFPGYPLTSIDCGTTVFSTAYKKLYNFFPDVFDFIIVFPSNTLFQPDTYDERVPYCVMVRNDVKNIGVPIFDESANYYSGGKLRSVVYHSFGEPAILEHELLHTWGMRLGMKKGLVDGSTTPGSLYGHWLAEADINGQLSNFINGCTVAENMDGTWRLKAQDAKYFPYSPLELYIMGLIPSNSVPPIHILHKANYSNPNRVTADSTTTLTIAEILASEGGERNPSYPNAQTHFRAAFIFVSDRNFTQAEFAYFSALAEYYGSDSPGDQYAMPFETATDKRATMDVTLPGMEYLAVNDERSTPLPRESHLNQNYPNPFNTSTKISFTLPVAHHVRLEIYDLLGRCVAILVDEKKSAGTFEIKWNAGGLASGVYFYSLNAGESKQIRKCLLMN